MKVNNVLVLLDQPGELRVQVVVTFEGAHEAIDGAEIADAIIARVNEHEALREKAIVADLRKVDPSRREALLVEAAKPEAVPVDDAVPAEVIELKR